MRTALTLLVGSMILLGGCASAPPAVTSTAPTSPWGTITPRFDPDANAIRVTCTLLRTDDDSVILAYNELRNGEGTLTVDGVLSPFSGPTEIVCGACGRRPQRPEPIDDGSRLWRHSDTEWECFFPVSSADALERLKNGGKLVINPRAMWRFNTLSHASYAW